METKITQKQNITCSVINNAQNLTASISVNDYAMKSELNISRELDADIAERGPQGPQGPVGPQGPKGEQGAQGEKGQDGVGIPAGGATGEFLAKSSETDYATEWQTIPKPIWGNITGDIENQEDLVELIQNNNNDELNNPFVLLEGKYFETPVYNVSWLQSNEGFTGSLALHPSAYNALLIEQNPNVEVGTTVDNYTKRGLSVKLDTEAYTDYDFVLNTTSQIFRCPTKLKTMDRYLVEYKQATDDDPSWYNLYSDGWCEQGGRTASGVSAPQAVTFLKPFKDINYNSLAGIGGTGSPNNNSFIVTTLSKTTTSMIIQNYNSSTGANNYYEWVAQGYVSETVTESLIDKLYFYVGETVQNANLVNVGRIEEKISNIIPDNSDLIASYGIPDYSAGIAFSMPFTLPANGYVNIYTTGSSQQNEIYVNGDVVAHFGGSNSQHNILFIPLNKGDTVTYKNIAGTTTVGFANFYPLKGAK